MFFLLIPIATIFFLLSLFISIIFLILFIMLFSFQLILIYWFAVLIIYFYFFQAFNCVSFRVRFSPLQIFLYLIHAFLYLIYLLRLKHNLNFINHLLYYRFACPELIAVFRLFIFLLSFRMIFFIIRLFFILPTNYQRLIVFLGFGASLQRSSRLCSILVISHIY